MSILGIRIKKERISLNMTREELANKIGVSYSTIAMYEQGNREPNNQIIIKLSELFDCSVDYLIGKSDYKSKWEEFNQKTDLEKIRNNIKKYEKQSNNPAVVLVYGTIPAGIPMEMIEDIIDTEEIDVNMLKGGKEYFGLRIKGNSMYPEYLDGDIIILEKVDNVENGSDAVVMVNGDNGTFKRVFKNENGIILQPLNPAFQPMVYTNEQIEKLPIKVIGKVVELRRKK